MSDGAPDEHEVLANFMAYACNQVGFGRMGAVSRGVIFIRSEQAGPGQAAAILTFPAEPKEATIAELEAAIQWLRAPDETPWPGMPSEFAS